MNLRVSDVPTSQAGPSGTSLGGAFLRPQATWPPYRHVDVTLTSIKVCVTFCTFSMT